MPAKNIEKMVTTWASPPRRWPTSAWARVIIRRVTSAEVMSSPTSRKKGTASSASESSPLKSWPTIESIETGVSSVATNTPAMMAKGTGTPR